MSSELPRTSDIPANSSCCQEATASSCQTENKDKLGVFIKTYGCQMNEYDSRKLNKILESGYRPVETPDQASLVILNTCSVRDKAEQKLYSVLGELQELKASKPDLLIGVGGCVAQQEGQKIIKRNKSVDFVFGTHNLSVVPALIEARQNGKGPQIAINYRDEWEDLPIGLGGEQRAATALISISRGCNKNCSYCIVPTTRGKEVSRPLDELLREVRISVHRGAKEILLLGQTVNSYGLDLSPRLSFAELLSNVAQIDGVERIRFISPHPQEIRQDFIDFLASCPQICRHIHMPLQSGSNKILKLMNRNYRREKYLRIIESLRARVPDISITTDLIVGFPTETEEDFQESLDILERVQFDASFSYIFSTRPGTPAAKALENGSLIDDCPLSIKKDRLQRWQARQNEITLSRLSQWIGKTCEVLIDGPSSHNPELLKGRNSQNILINIQNMVPGLKAGKFVKVKISEVSRYTLKGEICDSNISERSLDYVAHTRNTGENIKQSLQLSEVVTAVSNQGL